MHTPADNNGTCTCTPVQESSYDNEDVNIIVVTPQRDYYRPQEKINDTAK